MSRYKYQMHMHTFPCSACSQMDIKSLISALCNGGYSGGVITNHFIGGNTGIDRNLPWNELIAKYEKDYLIGKKTAMKLGLDLFFCIEEGVGGGKEIIPYGITPEILYRHPELRGANAALWHKVMQEEGCLVIQAHPFRERNYITSPGLLDDIDGIEVHNQCNDSKNNREAAESARGKNYILTSGGDAHTEDVLCRSGIVTERKIKDEKDLVSILKNGEYKLLTD